MKKIIVILLLIITIYLPISVMAADIPDDGVYMIEVNLTGGSGRTSVETPCELIVSEGEMTATLIWSSSYYTYVLMDGAYYYPINEDGNSTFEIPVFVLDQDIAISAETEAMSEPHVIEYTLYFDSSTLKSVDQKNKTIIIISIILVILATIIVVLVVKSKRKKRMEDRA